jgi:pyrimidine oxygenase
MGLWPGKEHYERRYEYSAECLTVMKDLWATGTSNHTGRYFQMDDCRLSPRPSVMPSIVLAGRSDVGMTFAAEYADFNFCLGDGVNTQRNAPARSAA